MYRVLFGGFRCLEIFVFIELNIFLFKNYDVLVLCFWISFLKFLNFNVVNYIR